MLVKTTLSIPTTLYDIYSRLPCYAYLFSHKKQLRKDVKILTKFQPKKSPLLILFCHSKLEKEKVREVEGDIIRLLAYLPYVLVSHTVCGIISISFNTYFLPERSRVTYGSPNWRYPCLSQPLNGDRVYSRGVWYINPRQRACSYGVHVVVEP